MKKSISLLFIFSLLISLPAASQGGLLKKVGKAMKDELLGTSGASNANQDPEPGCACSDAELVADLGGRLKLDYKELALTTMDDGSLLMQDRITGNYYIVKDGVTQGPVKEGDPRIAGFDNSGSASDNTNIFIRKYKNYISESGDKYVINFGGKSYGPYARIDNFVVTRSNDKFAALVVENIVVTESEGKNMDAAMKNAKTDQEKMDLAMKYAQQMQNKIISAGGAEGISTKLVTNIPNSTFNPMTGGALNAKIKYDDIMVASYDKVLDLQGKMVVSLRADQIGAKEIFVSSDNSKYAINQYGSLVISNSDKTLPDMFNPHLIKVNGTVYLAYMYYSPKKNGIMQCKIAF